MSGRFRPLLLHVKGLLFLLPLACSWAQGLPITSETAAETYNQLIDPDPFSASYRAYIAGLSSGPSGSKGAVIRRKDLGLGTFKPHPPPSPKLALRPPSSPPVRKNPPSPVVRGKNPPLPARKPPPPVKRVSSPPPPPPRLISPTPRPPTTKPSPSLRPPTVSYPPPPRTLPPAPFGRHPPPPKVYVPSPPVVPGSSTPKNNFEWLKMHVIYSKRAKARTSVDIMFAGDSLTEGWGETFGGKRQALYKGAYMVYLKMIYSLKASALLFGIGGDRIRNLRWRLTNGEFPETLHVKTLVLCIGINDLLGGYLTPNQAAWEIRHLIFWLRLNRPKTTIILVGLVPESYPTATAYPRTEAEQLNGLLTHMNGYDNGKVRYFDCKYRFLVTPKKIEISKYIPDYFKFLHLSANGYSAWSVCLSPLIKQVLSTSVP